MSIGRFLVALLALSAPALAVNACSDEINVIPGSGFGGGAASESSATQAGGAGNANGGSAAAFGSGAATASGGASATGGAGTASGGGGPCVPGATQCTDCIDNDNDGFTDAWDLECIGPIDDDESSFKTGIPGDNVDPCKQDCFFDGNSGSGNDGCLWDLACDPQNPGAPKCPYDPDKKNCPEISQKCIDECLGLTPNGCDCFGCCEITLSNMTTVTIYIGLDGCTEETASDPNVCKPCTQVPDCLNPCDPCEYCLGKVELPPECDKDGGMGGSGSGTGGNGGGCSPCAPEFPCPAGQYCLTGCCIPQ